MELWLLAAGALVLIGIAAWIVWPVRSAELVGTSVESKEVVDIAVTETVSSSLPPQGDRFQDQYTSATADLSAGAVGAAVEGMQHTTPTTNPEFPTGTYGAAPFKPVDTPAPYTPAPQAATGLSTLPRNSMSLGAGALLAVGGAVGGAWLYARWQRERNKPINRLRRGARDVASRLGERMPEIDELPRVAAPMSGAATALLLSALVASRALHRDDDTTQEVRDHATDLLRDSLEQAIGRSREAVEPRSRGFMGIGLGGMAVVAGGAYTVWRLLQRGQDKKSNWYAGQ